MPTGYTMHIEDGCSFEEYAWICARAFGALITMRDKPNDAEIPTELKPGKYHQEAIDKADADLKRLQNMSPAEIRLKINAEHARIERENAKRREEFKVKMQRYAAIKEKVEAFMPPTPEHEDYKRFMLEQIRISTERENPYEEKMPEFFPDIWMEQRIKKAKDDIEYHTKERDKEVERVNERNAWISALRLSIPQPKKAG